MKRKPISINRKDRFRVLLTELLPFELPIFFSNHKLYNYAISGLSNQPTLVRDILDHGRMKYTIPFNYKIERGDGRKRMISIMHPAWQLKYVDFYHDWDAYIISQCARSEFSLRRPVQVGSVFYESDKVDIAPSSGDEIGDLAPSGEADQRKFASTYFYYAKYNQIWKFYESTEFRRLEQDFRSLQRLDISRCFQSIYTHSISWAVSSKEFTKQTLQANSFGSFFDELMQGANWNETNGILVGPEVSRIFAEIILQRIDADLRGRLIIEGLLPDRICVRRYVDDYFIFFNRDEDASVVKKHLEESLEQFRLSLNEAKAETIRAPLITELSVARESIRQLLEVWLRKMLGWNPIPDSTKHVDEPATLKIGSRSADQLIKSIKGAMRLHSVCYSAIVPFALGLARNVLVRARDKLSDSEIAEINAGDAYKRLSSLVEVVFFLYRMDLRVNTTFKVSSILISITSIADRIGSIGVLIRQEIVDHGVSVLRQARLAEIGSAEMSSLLALLFYLGGERAISQEDMKKALCAGSKTGSSNYFTIVSALFAAGGKARYTELLDWIDSEIRSAFSSGSADIHRRAEIALLYFDIMSCPYVRNETKDYASASIARSLKKRALSQQELGELRNFFLTNLGFTDWDKSNELSTLLERRALQPAYD